MLLRVAIIGGAVFSEVESIFVAIRPLVSAFTGLLQGRVRNCAYINFVNQKVLYISFFDRTGRYD